VTRRILDKMQREIDAAAAVVKAGGVLDPETSTRMLAFADVCATWVHQRMDEDDRARHALTTEQPSTLH
jgi:hypothetical protein